MPPPQENIENADTIDAATPADQLTTNDIKELIANDFVKDAKRRTKYKENWEAFNNGIQLDDDEFGTHRIELKLMTRLCKTHASYVLKERPNIQVPAMNAAVPALRQHAAYIERALNVWWEDNSITRKLKKGILRACAKSDHIFYLNNKDGRIAFNQLDPEFFNYDTVSNDPDSPLLYVMMGELIDVKKLRKKYPAIADQILSTSSCQFFMNSSEWGSAGDLHSQTKAILTTVMDKKYLYTYINDIEISVKEHNWPKIPFYIFKYFDFGEKWGSCLIDFVKDPVKFINILLGYKADLALRTADPPLIISGTGAKIDANELHGGKITIPSGMVNYLAPPQAPIDLDKLLEIFKAFMHFLSGLSEESMAGFVGALTSAGVSIELRLDSTVREALDVQTTLKDILQQINADYLRFSEKFFKGVNLFESSRYGLVSDVKFTPEMINGHYSNNVDFGGILPRSQDQVVRNTLAMQNGGLISKTTALELLRFPDPAQEIEIMTREIIEGTQLRQQLEAGAQPDQQIFDNPKDEINYVLTEDKMPVVHPAQNHQEFIDAYEAKLKSVQSPLLIQLLIIRRGLIERSNFNAVPTAPRAEVKSINPEESQEEGGFQKPRQEERPRGDFRQQRPETRPEVPQ